jgi:hypothetical protein
LPPLDTVDTLVFGLAFGAAFSSLVAVCERLSRTGNERCFSVTLLVFGPLEVVRVFLITLLRFSGGILQGYPEILK